MFCWHNPARETNEEIKSPSIWYNIIIKLDIKLLSVNK